MKLRRVKLDLLEGNILKKLILLSTPLMITSFINMAYNMTDTAWLGRLGTDAVAATGAAHFFVWFSAALSGISRVGTGVYTAQEYGAKKHERLNDTIKNGLMLMTIILGIYTLIISLSTESLMSLYTLETSVKDMSVTYLRIFSFGFIITGITSLISTIYYSLGDSFYPFIANCIGLVANIILDPILIFGFGIIPPMGVAGAAVASILSQVLVLILFAGSIIKSKNEIYQALAHGKITIENMYEKFRKGLPAGLMSSIHSLISFQLTRYMTTYGTGPVAAYTVGSMLESITWMSAEGFQGGITAFVGQNYGAKLHDRLKSVIKISMLSIVAIGTIGTIILMVFRYPLFKIFIPNDPQTLEYGAQYLFILSLSQLFMAIEIGSSGVFNGLGQTKTPAIISVVFNVLRIPMAIFLMQYIDYRGVWLSMTISSVFKGIIAAFILGKSYKKLQ